MRHAGSAQAARAAAPARRRRCPHRPARRPDRVSAQHPRRRIRRPEWRRRRQHQFRSLPSGQDRSAASPCQVSPRRAFPIRAVPSVTQGASASSFTQETPGLHAMKVGPDRMGAHPMHRETSRRKGQHAEHHPGPIRRLASPLSASQVESQFNGRDRSKTYAGRSCAARSCHLDHAQPDRSGSTRTERRNGHAVQTLPKPSDCCALRTPEAGRPAVESSRPDDTAASAAPVESPSARALGSGVFFIPAPV